MPELIDPNNKLSNYSVTLQTGTFTIDRAHLIVKTPDGARTYGAENPTLIGTIVGLQNNDPISAVYSTAANALSPAGSYPIISDLRDPFGKLANYNMTKENGRLTVTKAELTVKANDVTRGYRTENPPFTGTVTGIQNNDDISAEADFLIQHVIC